MTGRRLTTEVEVTPEMIEAGEDEIYLHLSLGVGSGDVRECARAVFVRMLDAVPSKCLRSAD